VPAIVINRLSWRSVMPTDALTLAYACRWLEAVARAAAKGEITLEMELPDGRYLAAEEWPSEAAYREYARNREALKAMLAVSRLPA
jgi:hypothetical protein